MSVSFLTKESSIDLTWNREQENSLLELVCRKFGITGFLHARTFPCQLVIKSLLQNSFLG